MNHHELARDLIDKIVSERRGFIGQMLVHADQQAVMEQLVFWTQAAEQWIEKNWPDQVGDDPLIDIVRRLELLEGAVLGDQRPFAIRESRTDSEPTR